MKKIRKFSAALFISQILSGCIGLIPPNYRESDRATVIIIYESYEETIPESVFMEEPGTGNARPVENLKTEKYRKPEEKKPDERKNKADFPNSNERTRNSGERNPADRKDPVESGSTNERGRRDGERK